MGTRYEKGRRFEYERKRFWEKAGHDVWRSAGSHGLFDITTVDPLGTITLIQCKVVGDSTEGNRLLRNFKKSPPLGHRPYAKYHQVMEVKVSGSREVLSVRV